MVHWARFPAFKHVKGEAKKPLMTIDDRDRGAVFMRWKEKFLVPDHRVQDISGASFAGEPSAFRILPSYFGLPRARAGGACSSHPRSFMWGRPATDFGVCVIRFLLRLRRLQFSVQS